MLCVVMLWAWKNENEKRTLVEVAHLGFVLDAMSVAFAIVGFSDGGCWHWDIRRCFSGENGGIGGLVDGIGM